MYFTTQTKANYYDCDCNNQLKLSAAMKYMQQCSSEQLEHLGFSTERLFQENMVFLLSKMCIRVHRMPVCTETLVVGTAPTQPRGARFVREFILETPQGERLLSAVSLWVLVDPATRKIMRPSAFPYPLPFKPATLAEIVKDVAFPKQQKEKIHPVEIPVRYSHIDVNQHVNNTVYADFVCDVLPREQLTTRGIEMLAISFQNEAKWGDTVEIYTTALEQGAYHIVGQHGGSPCFEALATLVKKQKTE